MYQGSLNGFKKLELGKFTANSLSKDQKKALKKVYQKRWDDHLAGCNPAFGCQNKTWPNG